MNTIRTWLSRVPWRVWDLIEKTASTWLQAFIVTLPDSSFFVTPDASVLVAAGVAAVPAAITVILNVVNGWTPDLALPTGVQTVLRVVRTAVASGLGYLVAAPLFSFDPQLWRGAAMVAGTSLLAAVKAELASHVGVADTVGVTRPSPTDVFESLAPALTAGSGASASEITIVFSDGTVSTTSA